jgi:hypothetical protein
MHTKKSKHILNFAWLPIVAGLACALSAPAQADIIINGDFSSGNTGFSSQYLYQSSSLFAPGTYDVDTNPNNDHPAWSSFGDHTTGTGNMLVVNGFSPSSNQDVSTGPTFWSQTVSLDPSQNYTFSFWGAASYPVNPGLVQLTVDGVATGSAFSLTDTRPNWWNNHKTTFSSGNSSVTLGLVELTGAYNGNDFAIDDISVTPVPEPSGLVSMGLFLGGLACIVAYRKRNQLLA